MASSSGVTEHPSVRPLLGARHRHERHRRRDHRSYPFVLDLLALPDAGFRLERAVATTFTLHLTALLPVPLGLAGADLNSSTDPLSVLQAVRNYSDRIDVFCQAGHVSVPSQRNDLLAFLAIDRLQHDQAVDRIDIIYICSNAEIARQNIAKLDVRGDGTKPLSTRITMLATQLRDLNRRMPDGRKTVNLVAFTPGTSFDKGQRGGRVEERALLSWLLRPLMELTRAERNALQRILRMDVNEGPGGQAPRASDSFQSALKQRNESDAPVDPPKTEKPPGGAEVVSENGGWGARWGSNPRPSD